MKRVFSWLLFFFLIFLCSCGDVETSQSVAVPDPVLPGESLLSNMRAAEGYPLKAYADEVSREEFLVWVLDPLVPSDYVPKKYFRDVRIGSPAFRSVSWAVESNWILQDTQDFYKNELTTESFVVSVLQKMIVGDSEILSECIFVMADYDFSYGYPQLKCLGLLGSNFEPSYKSTNVGALILFILNHRLRQKEYFGK